MATKRYLKDIGVDKSWIDVLHATLKLEPLKSFEVDFIKNRENISPLNHSPLEVFTMPIESIKVVFIGDSPYSSKEASGLSFAKNRNQRTIPFALDVMVNEICRDYAVFPPLEVEFDYSLEGWKQQGVFLFNTSLTTELGKTDSHSDKWSAFTRHITRYLAVNRKNIVWVLLGKKAHRYENVINFKGEYPRDVYKVSNPKAVKYGVKFNGNGLFSNINKSLKKMNKMIINWEI